MLASLMQLASSFPVEEMGQLLSARMIVAADPPKHTRLREIVNRAFSPRRIADLVARIDEIVVRCTADLADRDDFDVVDELAVPLPVAVIADMLSVGPENHADIKRWSDEISSAAQGPNRGTPEAQAQVVSMLTEFAQYFVPRIEDRKRKPTDDLISALVRAEEQDTLSTVESLLFILVIMFAGNETTTNLIGNTVVSLMQNPDQLELVLVDPAGLLPGAIEETLRYRSPFQFFFREPLQDVTISGVDIPAGDTVCVMFGAANRDPARFADPDRYLVSRSQGHLAFGYGIHFCLGAHLARAETRTAVGALVPHLSRLRLDGGLHRVEAPMVFGYEHVNLVRRSR
jgi:cytochrome P450